MRQSDKKRGSAGFSLVELIIAVSILVMMTGALSPALVRYIEKGREKRDVQNIEMVYSAVNGALYDEIAYDSLKAGLFDDGVYSAPIAVSALFSLEDGFSEAVRDYMPTAPRLSSKKARGTRGSYQIMVDIRELTDQETGIRSVRACVWAGDETKAAGAAFMAGEPFDGLDIDGAASSQESAVDYR